MTAAESIPAAIGVGYLATALLYWHQGERGWSLVYLGYSIGNVGLVWAAVSGR